MHSLYPAPAWIWQTPKLCFLAWMTLWKPELFMRQAFSCAPSSSQKLYIIVNGAYTELQVPFQALQKLLCICWHGEAELCIETPLLTSCLWWYSGNKTQSKGALLSYMLICLIRWETTWSRHMSCAGLLLRLLQKQSIISKPEHGKW